MAAEDQMVKEPAEVLFVSQDRTQAIEILKLAFGYARAEAAALANLRTSERQPTGVTTDILGHPELIQSRRAKVEAEVASLKQRAANLQRQLAAAPRRKRDQIARDLSEAQNELELAQSRADFLATMSQFETADRGAGGTLLSQIDELQRTVPQAAAEGAQAAATPNLPRLEPNSEPAGLLAQGRAWLRLREKVKSIERRIQETRRLSGATGQTGSALQQAIVQLDTAARSLAGQGGTELGANPSTIEARRNQFGALLDRRKQIAAALLPLRKMSLLLARYDASLTGWRDEARQRAAAELYGVVTRAIALAIMLAVLLAVGIAWRRVAFRYVEDRRRRSQMVQLRNVVIGILIAIVLSFEFVSEVSSLATMIGLATAGIAVALQDVILSIAGYFRIGGRFGIKVGDWIEVQGVRGEVIDIGVTKLTLMELGGEGGEREPTGRLMVIPNSVVFREKFANRAYGTSLGWDEIELTVSPDCDYRMVEKRLSEVVEEVFARYREVARGESREMERRFNLKIEPPRPQSRIRVGIEGVRLSVRYPVDVRMRNVAMDEISRRLLDSFKRDPSIRLIPQTAANLQPNPDGVQPVDANGAPEPAPAAAPDQPRKAKPLP